MNGRSLLVTAALITALCSCDDGRGVQALAPGLTVAPGELVFEPLWAGHAITRVVTVTNTGTASLSGLVSEVSELAGPIGVDITLGGDALAPGATLALEVTVLAPMGSTGEASAAVVVDAGSDGAATVELRASVRVPPSCDDGNPCTSDRFNAGLGACEHDVHDDGSQCDDQSACTTGDTCVSGRCLGDVVTCDDGEECTADTCDASVGCVFQPLHDRCDDEDPCTENVCAPFDGCSNPPLDEGALCHFDGCAEIGLCFLGQCVLHEVPDGVPCEDGDTCTVNDTCQSGECTSGVEVGVGAAPPIVFGPDLLDVDLCRGPSAGSQCFDGFVQELGVERVLAVDRDGARFRFVWQGAYLDNGGAPCDPTDLLFAPLEIDPPEDEQPPPVPPLEDAGPANEGAGAMPMAMACAAGVYLTTLDVGFALSAPVTTQLTAVRGSAAAAFLSPTTMTGLAGGAAEDRAEPPPPLIPEAAVVVVHPDFLRTSLWLEQRTAEGALVSSARRWPTSFSSPFVDRLTNPAVAVDALGLTVVAHEGRIEVPTALCDAEGCDVVDVPLWTLVQPWDFSFEGTDRVVHLPRTLDFACAGSASEIPLVMADLSVFAGDPRPHVSLRMNRSLCGDEDPSSPGMAAWRFEVPLDAFPARIAPLETYVVGGDGLASFHTTADGAATALRHIPAPCECQPCDTIDDAENLDCACLPVEGSCFDTVVERTPDLLSIPPEVLLRSEGARLHGQTVPLVVEGELRVATLLGDHLELLGTTVDGVLSRIVAPAPPEGHSWDRAAPLLPGPAESMLVVGHGSYGVEPVFPPPPRALLQVFGCGLGGGASDDDTCLEDIDCDDGFTCDRSLCLPGPDCESTGTCDLCWGRCTDASVTSADDAGVTEEDAGALDDDAGSQDEDAGSLDDDAGAPPADGGDGDAG